MICKTNVTGSRNCPAVLRRSSWALSHAVHPACMARNTPPTVCYAPLARFSCHIRFHPLWFRLRHLFSSFIPTFSELVAPDLAPSQKGSCRPEALFCCVMMLCTKCESSIPRKRHPFRPLEKFDWRRLIPHVTPTALQHHHAKQPAVSCTLQTVSEAP